MFTFFAGSNAVEFVKQYAQAGLKERVPLFGAAYLTELDAAPAQGSLPTGSSPAATGRHRSTTPPTRSSWRNSSRPPAKMATSIPCTGITRLKCGAGLEKTKGDIKDSAGLSQALQEVEFDSPRGPFRFSRARNPIQNIYAIEAKGGKLASHRNDPEGRRRSDRRV